MGMCASGYIIQSKAGNVHGGINGVTTCIDDILVLIKEIFFKRIHQIIIIYTGMCYSGLKFNAPKCSLGLKEIPYL